MGTVIGGFYYSTYLYNNTKIKADRADGNSGSGDDDGIDAALDEAIEFVEGILEVDKDEDVLLLAAFMSKLLQLRYRRQHKRPATSGWMMKHWANSESRSRTLHHESAEVDIIHAAKPISLTSPHRVLVAEIHNSVLNARNKLDRGELWEVKPGNSSQLGHLYKVYSSYLDEYFDSDYVGHWLTIAECPPVDLSSL
ncbi:hypothetical protein TWF132_011929 [Orbilia oligospora]|nr:hypothetical protein TWF132_011929 [Orbilia oligospora]